MPGSFRIDGARLYLTRLQQANIRTHFRWNNDSELNRLDSEQPFEHESFGSFARRFQAMCRYPAAGEYDFEVHTRAGRLIGVAFLSGVCSVHRRGHVGVTIGERDVWGRGYGHEALGLLMRHGFERLDLHRIEAVAYPFNRAWRAVLAAAGFQQEGRRRDHLYRDGRFWDQEQYALLRREHARRPTASPAGSCVSARAAEAGASATAWSVPPDDVRQLWHRSASASAGFGA